MKSKKSILGNFIKRFFTLSINKLTFAYRTKQESTEYTMLIYAKSISRVSDKAPYEGPKGWNFGFTVQTKNRLFILFAQTEQIYRIWVEAFAAMVFIPIRPVGVIYKTNTNSEQSTIPSCHTSKEENNVQKNENLKIDCDPVSFIPKDTRCHTQRGSRNFETEKEEQLKKSTQKIIKYESIKYFNASNCLKGSIRALNNIRLEEEFIKQRCTLKDKEKKQTKTNEKIMKENPCIEEIMKQKGSICTQNINTKSIDLYSIKSNQPVKVTAPKRPKENNLIIETLSINTNEKTTTSIIKEPTIEKLQQPQFTHTMKTPLCKSVAKPQTCFNQRRCSEMVSNKCITDLGSELFGETETAQIIISPAPKPSTQVMQRRYSCYAAAAEKQKNLFDNEWD